MGVIQCSHAKNLKRWKINLNFNAGRRGQAKMSCELHKHPMPQNLKVGRAFPALPLINLSVHLRCKRVTSLHATKKRALHQRMRYRNSSDHQIKQGISRHLHYTDYLVYFHVLVSFLKDAMHLAHLAGCKATVSKYETREMLLIASSLHHEASRRKSTALHKFIQGMKLSVR